MARIFSGESFARKDMAQMGSAPGTENLRTASVGIRFAAHGTRNFIIEAGPAAAGIEFILRTVQRSTAPAAAVGAVFVVEVIFTGKGASVPFRTITRSSSGVNGFIFCAFKVIAMPVSTVAIDKQRIIFFFPAKNTPKLSENVFIHT